MACSCWDNQRPIDRGPATAANQPTAAGQGSTTAGQTGLLTLGAVTTGAPTFTNGQTSRNVQEIVLFQTIRCATRWASVFVFPEPAPAITRSGVEGAHVFSRTPCSTARRWSELTFRDRRRTWSENRSGRGFSKKARFSFVRYAPRELSTDRRASCAASCAARQNDRRSSVKGSGFPSKYFRKALSKSWLSTVAREKSVMEDRNFRLSG